MFGRHICRVLRPFYLGQLQASGPDFLLHPQVYGLRVTQTAEANPPPVLDCTPVTDEVLDLGELCQSRRRD